jgi:TolA-binding protein
MTQGLPPMPPAPPVDPTFLVNQVMPLLVLMVVFVGIRWVFRSPVGEALAERIRSRVRGRGGVAGEDASRVAGLEAQLSQLQGQVAELAERLDFAERMLAERRERKLGAGQ